MSAALVKYNDAPHTFVDDLESMFYVVLWLVLMYSPNSMMAEVHTSFMQQVLDPVQYAGMGGSTKADFLQGHSVLRDLKLHNPNRPELQTLLLNLATLFSVRYEPRPSCLGFTSRTWRQEAESNASLAIPEMLWTPQIAPACHSIDFWGCSQCERVAQWWLCCWAGVASCPKWRVKEEEGNKDCLGCGVGGQTSQEAMVDVG